MKRFERDTSNRRIAGICAGIGKTYDLDPLMVRLVVFFVTFASGIIFGLITYLIGWAVVPSAKGTVLSQLIGKVKPRPERPESVSDV